MPRKSKKLPDPDYEHDVFVSYAHHESLQEWVLDRLIPLLSDALRMETTSDGGIWADREIATGARWRDVLRQKVARSKVVVALLCAKYFTSEWCRKEMALMLARQHKTGFNKGNANQSLVIPIRIGDGLSFPKAAPEYQYRDFEAYASPFLTKESKNAEQFWAALRKVAKEIAAVINRAPPYHPSFITLNTARIERGLTAIPNKLSKPPRIL